MMICKRFFDSFERLLDVCGIICNDLCAFLSLFGSELFLDRLMFRKLLLCGYHEEFGNLLEILKDIDYYSFD